MAAMFKSPRDGSGGCVQYIFVDLRAATQSGLRPLYNNMYPPLIGGLGIGLVGRAGIPGF